MKNIKVYIQTSDANITVPVYAHSTDAGMDICAAEDVTLAPGETKLIRTGIQLAIPEGYECQVRPRSGISLKTPLRVCNAPGTIDAGYRDEVCVIIQNTSLPIMMRSGTIYAIPDFEEYHYLISEKGNKQGWYEIKKGDRIAQLVFAKYEKVQFETVPDVKTIGENRGGGFGSTGV